MKKLAFIMGALVCLCSGSIHAQQYALRKIDSTRIVETLNEKIDTFYSQSFLDSLIKDSTNCVKKGLKWESDKKTLTENRNSLNAAIQFFVLLFSALFLFMVWLHYETAISPKLEMVDIKKCSNDYGVPVLALALLFWAMVSLNTLRGAEKFSGLTYIFSSLNNGFFLVATTLFDHGFLKNTQKKKVWVSVFFAITAISIFVYLLIPGNSKVIPIMDFCFTLTAFILLGVNLGKSFQFRGLPVLVVVSWTIITLAIVAQLVVAIKGYQSITQSTILQPGVWDNVLHIVSQAALCSLLIALAFTWINEKSSKVNILNAFNKAEIIEDNLTEINEGDTRKEIEIIKALIGESENRKACQKMFLLFAFHNQEELKNDTIMIQSQIKEIERGIIFDLISPKDYSRERTKIARRLLHTLNEFELQLSNSGN